MSERDLTLPVRGMNCGNCVGHVERALGGVGGVANARVNLATEKANVRFDPDLVSVGDLVEAVQKTGRYAIPTETVTLPIGGIPRHLTVAPKGMCVLAKETARDAVLSGGQLSSLIERR